MYSMAEESDYHAFLYIGRNLGVGIAVGGFFLGFGFYLTAAMSRV